MRIVHDIQEEAQCAAYSRGNKIELSIVSGDDVIEIHGSFSRVRAALKEAMDVIDAHEELSKKEA